MTLLVGQTEKKRTYLTESRMGIIVGWRNKYWEHVLKMNYYLVKDSTDLWYNVMTVRYKNQLGTTQQLWLVDDLFLFSHKKISII